MELPRGLRGQAGAGGAVVAPPTTGVEDTGEGNCRERGRQNPAGFRSTL